MSEAKLDRLLDVMLDFKAEFDEFKKEMYEFKTDMHQFKGEMYDFKNEMNRELNQFKEEMNDFRQEVYKRFDQLEGHIDLLALRQWKNEKEIDHIKKVMVYGT